MRIWAMAQTVCVLLDDTTTSQLAGIASDRSLPLKHILRARIVKLLAARLSVQDVARRAGVSRPTVWRWQRRFAEEGVEGLLRDKTRPPSTPPHSTWTVAEVLALTCSDSADGVTHWTRRAVAERIACTGTRPRFCAFGSGRKSRFKSTARKTTSASA